MAATSEELLALALICERAAEGSEELDEEIRCNDLIAESVRYRMWWAFTRNMQDSLALLPDGCGWTLTTPWQQPSDAVDAGRHKSYAATPALALTAACLRARAAQGGGRG